MAARIFACFLLLSTLTQLGLSLTPSPSPAPSPDLVADASFHSPPLPAPSPMSPSPAPSPHLSISAPPAPVPSPDLNATVPTPAPAPVESDVNHSDSVSAEEDVESSGGISGGKKAGIAVGVIAAACLVGLGGLVYKKRQDNIRRSQYGSAARRELL